MCISLVKLVKFSFLFFLLFATSFIIPVNKDYQMSVSAFTNSLQDLHTMRFSHKMHENKLRERTSFVSCRLQTYIT